MAFKSSTVNASKVAATLSNFPSFINPSRIGITTLAEAQSSRFYADSGKVVEWAREVVSAAEIHAKIPSLTTTVTQHCDYDGVRADYAVTDTYGRNAVWSDYEAVLHMNSDQTDSTGKLSPSQSNVSYSAGKINNGGDFESSTSSNINFGDPASFTGMTGLTIQTWLKPESFTNYGMISAKGDLKSWEFRNDATTGKIEFTVQTNGTGITGINGTKTNSALSTGVWAMAHAIFDSSLTALERTRIYINGSKNSTNQSNGASQSTTIVNSTDTAYIGRRGDGFYWDGMMDEWRLRASALSADWITTEYNNQNDEGTFWGTWADVGGAVQNSNFLMFM